MKLEVVNLVATANLDQPVDILKLEDVRGFLYDHAIYHCAYLRDENTHAKVSVFASGKMISIGTKSLREATYDLNYAQKRLVQLGLVQPREITPELQNIVAMADVRRRIDLEALASKLDGVIYAPEVFPAVIYYPDELEGASLLIFATGRILLSGLKRQRLLHMGKLVIGKLAGLDPRKKSPCSYLISKKKSRHGLYRGLGPKKGNRQPILEKQRILD